MSTPKVKKPKPPPKTPTMADPSIIEAGDAASRGYSSLISTTPVGLERRAETVKRSLIGGAM